MKKNLLIGAAFVISMVLTALQKPLNVASTNNGFFSEADSNKLYCPDDMEISLWAESPMFYNPTNIDVDARGRVWVTEAVNYRDFNNKPETRLNHEKGERVMILEDTDQDGKADKSTVFAEDKEMISPLGIAVVGNKVYVSAAPNLYVFTDENGDDKADKKEIFLTGFGGKDHDHSLHSGVMTPDGQFFFNVGNAGPHHVRDKAGFTLRSGSIYTGGTPYNKENHGNQFSDDGRVWVGGMALKIGKDGKGLKVLGHNFRNSYEVAMDSYGNMWQNDNDDQVIACRTSFLMENGNAGYFSSDGTRTWQADRRPNQDIFTASWHQEDPGVMPACDNTGAGSPTGFHVYEGDAFGEKYRGMLLSAEAGRNVIFNYFPTKKGAGFELNRNDLVSSQGLKSSEKYEWYEIGKDTRKWFRPSDVCASTDGSIFIADWYDPIVGGHAMHDKKGYGRIYRLTPKGKKLVTPKIDVSSIEGQIEALKNPAQNVRYLGFEALFLGGQKSIPVLKVLLSSENPFHRARAIWLLAQLGDEGKSFVENLLHSNDEDIRLVAFRALRGQNSVVFLCEKMASDQNSAIRREVAIALRDIPFENAEKTITKILQKYDGNDDWYLEAIGTAADRKEEQVYELAKTIFKNANDERLANIAWRLHPSTAIEDLKANVIHSSSEKSRSKSLTALAFIKDKKAVLTMIELSKSPKKDVSTQAVWWLNFRKTNEWADLMNWESISTEIVSSGMKKMLSLKEKLINKNTPEQEKITIAKEMAKDPDGGNILVDLKAGYQINDKIAKEISEIILNNPEQKVRILASQFFPRSGTPLKLDFINRMEGNVKKGEITFTTYCATCHKHGENGNEIGPDLTNIHKKFDKLSLLDAIINPSANMVFGFETYTIKTKQGKYYMGFLIGDNGKNLIIKDAAGEKHVVKVADILKKEKMEKSLMPDPTSMGLKEQELSDLSSYLLSFQ
ncbi:PVC-type heme-binding CxxCH protein [Emticicia sp. SJ17W-69]|uniref:PVC-type heme-binding CxxCH protein n=1 Tax=Emticicia sp. SJ17W-69 TaxID=3421657 RepID=UPI003EBD4B1E